MPKVETPKKFHYRSGNDWEYEVIDGSLHIWGTMRDYQRIPVTFDRWFSVGDVAEFDSYNTSFFGKIVKVTPKTVTIDTHGLKKGAARLSFYEFIWRNWNFDATAARQRNLAWMD